MVFGYPIRSDVVETIQVQEVKVLKRLEEKEIDVHSYGEGPCSWSFDTEELILGVNLGEQTTQRAIEKKRKTLQLNADLQALLDKYKIERKLMVRAYGYHS